MQEVSDLTSSHKDLRLGQAVPKNKHTLRDSCPTSMDSLNSGGKIFRGRRTLEAEPAPHTNRYEAQGAKQKVPDRRSGSDVE